MLHGIIEMHQAEIETKYFTLPSHQYQSFPNSFTVSCCKMQLKLLAHV
jgi:hypothetical protein